MFELHLNLMFCLIASLINNKVAGDEEEFSIVFQKYPAVFDKSTKDCHRKDVKKNAWDDVAEELGLKKG